MDGGHVVDDQQHALALRAIEAMSQTERHATLKRAGLLDSDGGLVKKYIKSSSKSESDVTDTTEEVRKRLSEPMSDERAAAVVDTPLSRLEKLNELMLKMVTDHPPGPDRATPHDLAYDEAMRAVTAFQPCVAHIIDTFPGEDITESVTLEQVYHAVVWNEAVSKAGDLGIREIKYVKKLIEFAGPATFLDEMAGEFEDSNFDFNEFVSDYGLDGLHYVDGDCAWCSSADAAEYRAKAELWEDSL